MVAYLGCYDISLALTTVSRPSQARITARTIEPFHKGDCVAVHVRGGARGRHTTLPGHIATGASTTSGVDDQRIVREASCHRTRDGDADNADPAEQAAPGTGLPGLPWHPAPGAQLRRRTAEAACSWGSRSAPAPTAAFSRSCNTDWIAERLSPAAT
jgi:hypothetical protein